MSDSQNQLVQVLIQCGLPEEQLLPSMITFRGSSPILDTIAALLCYGLYPNVCYHMEKRKVWNSFEKLTRACFCFVNKITPL